MGGSGYLFPYYGNVWAIEYYEKALNTLYFEKRSLSELSEGEDYLLLMKYESDISSAKGISLRNLGKYEEAIRYFDKALEINPNYIEVRHTKANALFKLGKYEEAINA